MALPYVVALALPSPIGLWHRDGAGLPPADAKFEGVFPAPPSVDGSCPPDGCVCVS